MLLDASEQMNKNIAVVAEVAFWAKTLGRTFVEPVYCDSRVASPFNQTRDAGFNVSHWAADMSRLAHKQLTDRHMRRGKGALRRRPRSDERVPPRADHQF